MVLGFSLASSKRTDNAMILSTVTFSPLSMKTPPRVGGVLLVSSECISEINCVMV